MAFKSRSAADKHNVGTLLSGTVRQTANGVIAGSNDFGGKVREWIAVTVDGVDTIASLPPWLELGGDEAPGDAVRIKVVEKFDKDMNPTGRKAFQVIG